MSEANVTMASSTPQAALGRKLVAAAANSRELSVILAALAMFVALSLSTDTFFTELNLLNLLRQISVIGILAVGSTFIFISGEIDLSVGALHGLLAMICAALAIKMEGNIYGAALVVVALGAILSGINGVITTKLRIPSFITTLGMLSIYSGATLVLSKGMPIRPAKRPFPLPRRRPALRGRSSAGDLDGGRGHIRHLPPAVYPLRL
jgi:ribose transport system permease protein